MRILNIITATLLITCATVIVCTIVAVIDSRAIFVTLAFLIIGGLIYCRRHRRRDYYIVHLCTSLISLGLLYIVLPLAQFMGAGFDDGPFYGEVYSGDVSSLTASESVPFRSGRLVVYNRNDDDPPVLAYEDQQGDTKWAVEMDVDPDKEVRRVHLRQVRNMRIENGVLRDVVRFTGCWTFGCEAGWAYIWKLGGFQKFYLSW